MSKSEIKIGPGVTLIVDGSREWSPPNGEAVPVLFDRSEVAYAFFGRPEGKAVLVDGRVRYRQRFRLLLKPRPEDLRAAGRASRSKRRPRLARGLRRYVRRMKAAGLWAEPASRRAAPTAGR